MRSVANGITDRTSDLHTGTDHPFFPPLKLEQDQWESVDSNKRAVSEALSDQPLVRGVMGQNAIKIFDL